MKKLLADPMLSAPELQAADLDVFLPAVKGTQEDGYERAKLTPRQVVLKALGECNDDDKVAILEHLGFGFDALRGELLFQGRRIPLSDPVA